MAGADTAGGEGTMAAAVRVARTFTEEQMDYVVAMIRLEPPRASLDKHYDVLWRCALMVGERVWNLEWTHEERCPVLREVYRRVYGKESSQWRT